MKNLKKVLALVLAFACAFTMFAGAAFTDQADISVDADAVDTLVALGVIDGYEDGSFQPEVTVTRAEMAKMIYVLRTGNSDASAYNDDATSFTDITSHWARGYIKYCQSMGIIAGKSTTSFDPDADVTTQEAAKMLLVTLGYDAERAGLEGSGWGQKTTALADENGLLEDVFNGTTQGLQRQYAAQMMYNAIDAPTVVYRDGAYTTNNYGRGDNPTIGEKYMDLRKTVGTLSSVSKTSGKDTYELTIDKPNADESSANYLTSFNNVSKDYSDLKYQTVKVLYKAKDEVYGVFATDDNTSTSGLLADLKMDGNKVKLNGTKYDLASDTAVYVDGELQTSGNKNVSIKTWVDKYYEGNQRYGKGSSVELLATDGSSNYSILNVTTYTVEQVTYVGSDYINAGGKLSEEDYNIAEDIQKNDYVVISAAGNYSDKKGLVEKAEVVEGKITSAKGDDKVAIGDDWYTMNTGVAAPKLGANVKLIIVNGYVYEKDTITAGTSDIALVVEVGTSSTVGSKYYQARMIFADGTDKVVDIEKTEDDGKTPVEIAKMNKLATFTVSKDVYTLSFIDDGDAAVAAGYEKYVEETDKTIDGSVNTTPKTYMDNDAVVFVRYKGGDYKVVTGKTAANWNATTVKNLRAVTTVSNQLNYAQVAFLNLGSANVPGGSDTTYAVALDDSYTSKIDGTTYTMVQAWNGSESVLYKSEDTAKLNAGDIFEYSNDGDGVVSITPKTTTTAEVKSYDEASGDIVFGNNVARKIDADDTTILYVDSEAGEGVGDGEIRLGDSYNDSGEKAKANVAYFIDGSDDYVSVIVVDVNNNYTAW